MKHYPQKPKATFLEELRVDYRTRYGSSVAQAGKSKNKDNWHLFEAMWVDAIDLAALEYALDASQDTVRQYWLAACDYAERLLQLRRPFGTNMFRITLALANLLSRVSTRQLLESLERPTFVNPDVLSDELDYLTAEVMGDLSAERIDSANTRLVLAEKSTGDRDLPKHVRELFIPLMHLESAVARGNLHDLDLAVKQQVESHRRWYSSPRHMRNTPGGLIDYVGLGLLQIAQRRGLKISVPSVFLPQEYL